MTNNRPPTPCLSSPTPGTPPSTRNSHARSAVFLPSIDNCGTPTHDELLSIAIEYIRCGIPVAPFDPTMASGKSCWNIVGHYDNLAHDEHDVREWAFWNRFRALATSPGEIGCVVLDIDKPDNFPREWRKYVRDSAVPFINTRPEEDKRRGHYWFTAPYPFANSSLDWGDIRSVGGGIVLPPHRGRIIRRHGEIPPLPTEIAQALPRGVARQRAGGCGAISVSVEEFRGRHNDNARPQKLRGLLAMHERLSQDRNPHDAMCHVLRVGLGEAKLGYVPAGAVIDTMAQRWPSERPFKEFDRIVAWCVGVVTDADPHEIKRISDRPQGTDTRRYPVLEPGKSRVVV